jgi:hypothetical protein
MMKERGIILDQAADKAWPCCNVVHVAFEIKWSAVDHSELLPCCSAAYPVLGLVDQFKLGSHIDNATQSAPFIRILKLL